MGDSLDDLEQRAAVAEGQLLSRKWKCRKKKLDPATLEAVRGWLRAFEPCPGKQGFTKLVEIFESARTTESLRAAVEKGMK